MPYTSIEFVKSLANINHEDLGYSGEPEFNNLISHLIECASALVDDYCGQTFSEPVPQTIQVVTALIVVNMLHEMLQRRVSPIVQQNSMQIKLIISEAFTDGLKRLLNPYRHLNVLRG